MKKIIICALSVISVFCINNQSYAGQWKLNNANWQYTNEDGSITKNQWKQISGQWYCFDNNGNMYADTFTPDGYLVSASGEWCIPGSTYMNVAAVNNVDKNTAIPFAEDIKHDDIILTDSSEDINGNVKSELIDHGQYYELSNMQILKPKEYYLILSPQCVGSTVNLNEDEYLITDYFPEKAFYTLKCIKDNTGKGQRWYALVNQGNVYVLSGDADLINMETLFAGSVYLRKDCAINEITWNGDWSTENATVLQHFEASNACNNKYATEGQIFGTFKLDSNGLVTEIDQIFCS